MGTLEQVERFGRGLRLAAFLHDLGKANDHFQEMIYNPAIGKSVGQGYRHKAILRWIVRLLEFYALMFTHLINLKYDLNIVEWAIAGHHREFAKTVLEMGVGWSAELRVLLIHPDFKTMLISCGQKRICHYSSFCPFRRSTLRRDG